METHEINKNKLLDEYRKIYRHTGGLFDQICALHKDDPITIQDHTTQQSKVCFVLSCPGQYELINEKVCWGETGENLDKLLQMLNKENPDIFLSFNRYDYDILNASDVVHFYALDKKTEASKREIEGRIQRIYDYVDSNKNLSYMILLGKKAEYVKEKLEKKIQNHPEGILIVYDIPHLGYQSLNQIGIDVNDNQIDEENYSDSESRTKARLEVIAKKIIEQINKHEKSTHKNL